VRSAILNALPILLLVLLGPLAVAAVLLAAGSLLAHFFAVSVWEATVVVMVGAAGIIWLLSWAGPSLEVEEGDQDEAAERVVVVQPDLPWRSAGRRRRRRS
jgi:uncharacterized membrane protein YuzA (DUF378 family)